MNFEHILKTLRHEKNISQTDLANILHIDRTTYNHYENNYNTIPIKHLNIICNYFNVSFDYLFNFNSERNYLNIETEIKNEKVAKRLKEFRKSNKLTQAKLASVLKTNQSVIANYERGRTIIATPFLYEICIKYNVSADYLLGRIN